MENFTKERNPQEQFAEAIALYEENRRAEIAPQMWRAMERVSEGIEAEMTTREIQGAMLFFGWTPSKKQIAKIRELLAKE